MAYLLAEFRFVLMKPLTRKPLPAVFLAIPIGIFVLSYLFSINTFYGVGFALLACSVIVLFHTGIEISPDVHSYREYYGLFNWRGGKWQPLPPIVGVTLKRYVESVPTNSNKYSWDVGKSPTWSHELLVLMLSIQNSSTGMVLGRFAVSNTDDAIECAHEVAKIFNVKVNLYLSPTKS